MFIKYIKPKKNDEDVVTMKSLIDIIMIASNQILKNQETVANNIANISTPGFKSELESKIIFSNENDTNRYQNNDFLEEKYIYKRYKNNALGTLKHTNKSLDYTIENEDGWFVLKIDPNTVAYTKNGHFKINKNRQLTIQNHAVLGENGEIFIPQNSNITISSDGVIKITTENLINYPIEKLKFKQININNLNYKKNGFYFLDKHNKSNSNKKNATKIKLLSGVLEDSNVNLEENMIKNIHNARKFDIQMKLLSMYNENTQSMNRFLNLNS